MHPAFLLAVTLIVLQSGERIAVEGNVRELNGAVVFRAGGVLYSLPLREVVRITSPDGPGSPVEPEPEAAGEEENTGARPIRVSDERRRELIAALEKNHTGTPAPPLRLEEIIAPPPTAEETRVRESEEEWRRRARWHDESVQQATEELQLLENRIAELQWKIQGLVALGYHPRQFTYDSSELVVAREQLPRARLEIARAERARAQFREDARRQGILPGWLR